MFQEICEPCHIKYDFIAKLETLADDLELLLPKLKAPFLMGSFPKQHSTSHTTYGNMYKNVSRSLMDAVKDKYRADGELFGYDMNVYDNMIID